jgi:cysteine sulfinate desulfinase/cysteine desulfurase-like protein
LLTQLAQSSAGLAVLSQVPGSSQILSLIKSGQGLVSQIQGASQLLGKISNIPGAAELLKNIPGASDILSNIDFSAAALDLPLDLNSLDISAFELPGDLLGGIDSVLADAGPIAEEVFSEIASFW